MRIRMLRTIANSKEGSVRNTSTEIAECLIRAGAAELVAPALDMSPAAIRAWAETNGVEVSAKGFIKKSVTEAYKAANGG
jgi:hypothetical protein